ncbi:hypothetical protein CH305_21385 [Rhodococcus sp. 15-649-2-2]|uniref:hypothetical protein n=1 Tax=Rhodococcus sp. 15-649-2-2 TaxID=2023140 RepID=UPI000B9B57EF|nr:hypothetical protein [Rhodococcus sp. 15-649-2-2]OZE74243.1 hypothetical protein CH305_21385 [Rhodococcus sp. 15-649-2-2]
MDTVLALVAVVTVLVIFVAIARLLRSRMRSGRFHGIESSVGGSAFMGATRKPGIAPPDRGDSLTDTSRSEASPK